MSTTTELQSEIGKQRAETSEVSLPIKKGSRGPTNTFSRELSEDIKTAGVTDTRTAAWDSDPEPTLSNYRSDAQITEEIRNASRWHIPLQETINVLVEGGRVTLRIEAI